MDQACLAPVFLGIHASPCLGDDGLGAFGMRAAALRVHWAMAVGDLGLERCGVGGKLPGARAHALWVCPGFRANPTTACFVLVDFLRILSHEVFIIRISKAGVWG